MPNRDALVALGVVLFLFACGILAGYLIWGTSTKYVEEKFAPAIEMKDGSKVLSREPDGKTEIPQPKHPKGHKPVRTIEVTVEGGKPVTHEPEKECYSAQDFTCPSVTVRVDLLRAPDGTYRAQAVGKDGIVLDGVDIPLEDALVSKPQPWAVGYERAIDGSSGAFVERDIGRLRVGATIIDGGASARIGWRF